MIFDFSLYIISLLVILVRLEYNDRNFLKCLGYFFSERHTLSRKKMLIA